MATALYAALLKLLAERVKPPLGTTMVAIHDILHRQSFPVQLQLLALARRNHEDALERLVLGEVSRMLRDRSTDVLRVVLGAPDDLEPQDKLALLREPLLTPPAEADRWWLRKTELEQTPAEDESVAACLAELDARSLRALKAVSAAWRARARHELGDPASRWRSHPEWSAGRSVRESLLPAMRGADPAARKEALRRAAELDPAVELPELLPDLVCRLSDARSSVRAAALQALAALEPATLLALVAEPAPAVTPAEPTGSSPYVRPSLGAQPVGQAVALGAASRDELAASLASHAPPSVRRALLRGLDLLEPHERDSSAARRLGATLGLPEPEPAHDDDVIDMSPLGLRLPKDTAAGAKRGSSLVCGGSASASCAGAAADKDKEEEERGRAWARRPRHTHSFSG